MNQELIAHALQAGLILALVYGTLRVSKILMAMEPKEGSLVRPKHTESQLYEQIDYLCEEHAKVVEENKRLIAECEALRQKSVYSVK